MSSWIEYPVTRPFTLKRFSLILTVIAVIWCALVTLLSVATVGYEAYPINSDQFHLQYRLWYERIFPRIGWLPESRTCDGSIIRPSESNSSLFRLLK
jgi:hypothetical protein